MMYGYYESGMGWWMVLSTLFWLLLAGIAVWALVRFLSRHSEGSTSGSTRQGTADMPDGPSAEEILRQRFARGEIDAATFERMQAQLQASVPTQATPRNPVLPESGR